MVSTRSTFHWSTCGPHQRRSWVRTAAFRSSMSPVAGHAAATSACLQAARRRVTYSGATLLITATFRAGPERTPSSTMSDWVMGGAGRVEPHAARPAASRGRARADGPGSGRRPGPRWRRPHVGRRRCGRRPGYLAGRHRSRRRCPRCTVPARRWAASWSGMACMPIAGTAESPMARQCSTTSAMRALPDSAGSSWMPPSSGRKKRSMMRALKPCGLQRLQGADVGPAQQVAGIGRLHPAEQLARGATCRVASRSGASALGSSSDGRRSRVADGVGALAGPHQRAGQERTHLQAPEVELRRHLGVRREEDLEATVEPEAVDEIGAHPAPDPVGGLEHHHGSTGVLRHTGRGEAGEARTDHDHVDGVGQRAGRGVRHCPHDVTHRDVRVPVPARGREPSDSAGIVGEHVDPPPAHLPAPVPQRADRRRRAADAADDRVAVSPPAERRHHRQGRRHRRHGVHLEARRA